MGGGGFSYFVRSGLVSCNALVEFCLCGKIKGQTRRRRRGEDLMVGEDLQLRRGPAPRNALVEFCSVENQGPDRYNTKKTTRGSEWWEKLSPRRRSGLGIFSLSGGVIVEERVSSVKMQRRRRENPMERGRISPRRLRARDLVIRTRKKKKKKEVGTIFFRLVKSQRTSWAKVKVV